MKFQSYQSIYYYLPSIEITENIKVAAFDLDSTLIKTKSTRKFPIHGQDWQWENPHVPARLKQLYQENYQLVIFSNQKGVSTGKTKIQDLEEKLTAIQAAFSPDIPISVFISTKDDYYRKPMTGMWEFYLEKIGVQVDLEASFYCGDAMGRFGDFSASDLFFAYNIRLSFIEPSQKFFQGTTLQPFRIRVQDFHSMKPIAKYSHLLETIETKSLNLQESLSTPFLIMMVGPPASGKSSLTKRLDAVQISQDKLKTKKKCLVVAQAAIAEGKSLIIDNTNPTVADRRQYLDLVTSAYTCLAIDFRLPDWLLQIMNCYRVQSTQGVKTKIPKVAYNVFRKKYQPPTEEEGFHQIKVVDKLIDDGSFLIDLGKYYYSI